MTTNIIGRNMKRVLVIAPHADDEILGCGGTMIKHISDGDEVYVCIVTTGWSPLFNPEGTRRDREDSERCHTMLGVKKTLYLNFPAAALEDIKRYELNDKLLQVIKEIQPNIVYIPHIGDMQKDHKLVNEACMVALRPKYFPQISKILCYETMSETAWDIPNVQNAFIPNVFVDITRYLDGKMRALGYYTTQVNEFPDARSLGAIEALAKYRGALMHWHAAEAFVLVRELL